MKRENFQIGERPHGEKTTCTVIGRAIVQDNQGIIVSQNGLKSFSAYTKALRLFDSVVTDLQDITNRNELTKLIAQQLASADSIAANIEEGYGRETKRDYSHFLIIARGSAQETMGRYQRLKHWIDPRIIESRVSLCGEIIAILTASIRKLRTPA